MKKLKMQNRVFDKMRNEKLSNQMMRMRVQENQKMRK